MLQRKPDGKEPKLHTYGFLIGVELEAGVLTAEQAALRLGDALSFVEGVGRVDVDCLGEIEAYEE